MDPLLFILDCIEELSKRAHASGGKGSDGRAKGV